MSEPRGRSVRFVVVVVVWLLTSLSAVVLAATWLVMHEVERESP